MELVHEEEKRSEFRELLFKLGKEPFSLKDRAARSIIYQQFEKVYYCVNPHECFRHFYSDIFSVLTEIKHDDTLGSVDILVLNLSEIRKGYHPCNKDSVGNIIDISDSLKKLYDHVNLEFARINYSDAADRELKSEETLGQIRETVVELQKKIDGINTNYSGLKGALDDARDTVEETRKAIDGAQSTINDIQNDIQSAQNGIHSAQNDIQSAQTEIKNAQKEYIAILGIFASVVLAFIGGIAFSTSVFENMHQVSIYRAVTISLVIGLVLTNVLYGLFWYIHNMIKEPKGQVPWPLIIANSVILVLLAGTIFAWHNGFVESREKKIDEKFAETTIADEHPDMPETSLSSEELVPETSDMGA